MSEKRRDSKGRILRVGESQRKDGRYQYRYQDINGDRRSVYALDLHELRELEKEIEKYLSQGNSFFDGKIEFKDLLDKLFLLKRNWRDSTRNTMRRYLKIVAESRLYHMPINKIKILDCKTFFVEANEKGYSFGTLNSIHAMFKMAFSLAIEDNVISKNPCTFSLKSVIPDNTETVCALTIEQEESLFAFLREDTYGKRHLDMYTILIGTGMRISEFAALTIQDIDFENNVIHVNKQVVRLLGRVTITKPKTDRAIRDIPMTPAVRDSAQNLIQKRKKVKVDVMIDGHVGFLSVTRNGRPRTHSEYADLCRLLLDRHNYESDVFIERCTPHVLRHTFCTRCVALGMDVKSVQYLMGHSEASTTLNVYTDNVFEKVVEGMKAKGAA